MDDRLRALERARGDSPEAEAAWLAARLRAGTVDADLLRAAALAGHGPSAAALGLEARPDPEEFLDLLERQPEAVRARVGAAAARAAAARVTTREYATLCEAILERLEAPTVELQALRAANEELNDIVRSTDPAAVAVLHAADVVLEGGSSFDEVVAFLGRVDVAAQESAWSAAATALAELVRGAPPPAIDALTPAPERPPSPDPDADPDDDPDLYQPALGPDEEEAEREWLEQARAREARKETWALGLLYALMASMVLGVVAILSPVVAGGLAFALAALVLVLRGRRKQV